MKTAVAVTPFTWIRIGIVLSSKDFTVGPKKLCFPQNFFVTSSDSNCTSMFTSICRGSLSDSVRFTTVVTPFLMKNNFQKGIWCIHIGNHLSVRYEWFFLILTHINTLKNPFKWFENGIEADLKTKTNLSVEVHTRAPSSSMVKTLVTFRKSTVVSATLSPEGEQLSQILWNKHKKVRIGW